MLSLSKRRFVQLAGLSIANRILPGWLHAQESAPRRASNRVIIVTFGGGVRYSETFAPEGLRNIPRLVALRPEGHFFQNCINSGVLSHFNSTASIVTGNWRRGPAPPTRASHSWDRARIAASDSLMAQTSCCPSNFCWTPCRK